MEACSLLVNLRKGMQGSSEQPLVGEEHCVTTLITAATETTVSTARQRKLLGVKNGWHIACDACQTFHLEVINDEISHRLEKPEHCAANKVEIYPLTCRAPFIKAFFVK